MKILCLCRRGNSRSVTAAYVLKHWHKHDALAAGVANNQGETLEMLCQWAEAIVLTDSALLPRVPDAYRGKLTLWDVGTDRFFAPNAELVGLFKEFADSSRFKKELG